MPKKHKIALSDEELRIIIDALDFSQSEFSGSTDSIKTLYDHMIIRLKKTLGKED